MDRVVVDTAYILPLFGIRVTNIDNDLLYKLSDKEYVLMYPELLITELVGKIGKNMRKGRLREIPLSVTEALEALLLETDILLIKPKREHLETAIKLKVLGHDDMFDNILYATAIHEKAMLLMKDPTFESFLKKHKLRTDIIVKEEILNDLMK